MQRVKRAPTEASVMEPVDLGRKIAQQHLQVKAMLAKKGLELPTRPAAYGLPKLPTNLTDQDDSKIMRLLAQFTRYQDHLAGLLALAEIDETAAANLLEIAKARHMAGNWTGPSSDRVAISKANATLDKGVQECEQALEQCRAKRKVYGVLVESLARSAAVVSRELSRRIGNQPTERRNSRFNT